MSASQRLSTDLSAIDRNEQRISALSRVTELERELAAAVAERDELRADHARIVTEKFDALIERDTLRARLAAIDAAPTVAIADSEYHVGVVPLDGVWGLPIGTELIAKPAKEAT